MKSWTAGLPAMRCAIASVLLLVTVLGTPVALAQESQEEEFRGVDAPSQAEEATSAEGTEPSPAGTGQPPDRSTAGDDATPAGSDQGFEDAHGSETTGPGTAADSSENADVETVPVVSLPPEPPEPPAVKEDLTQLDEIVVTAQRKAQSIFDVPVSMTVIDDEFLAKQGITDLTEMSRYVPNTKIRTDLAFGQSVSIRGFTKQAGNAAFEQAVGLLIDGVSYNDNDYFMTALLDIERVEILRGPQGTLLGKNATGGLLNITTKEPTDAFEGFVDLQTGQAGRQVLSGAFGGPVPLLDGLLNFRFAGSSDARDGVFGNTTGEVMEGVPREILNRDRSALRVKLEAPDLFGSRLALQYEKAEAAYTGTGFEIVDIPEGNRDFLLQYDPKLDVIPGNFVGSVDHAGDTGRLVEKALGRWSSELGDWSLDAIASYGNVSGAITGSDATPAPLAFFLFDTTKPQTSYEIIVSTPSLFDVFDVTAGVFWQRRELNDFLAFLELDTAAFAAWLDSRSSPTTPPKPPPTPPEGRESTTLLFNQRSDSLAGYGQVSWKFAERWNLIGGVRVTEEKKTADWQRTVSDNSVILTELLGYEDFTAERERREVLSMPKVALQYRPDRDISLFVHWAQGFRSGGFNAGATTGQGLEFEPEVLTERAFNAKTRFFDGALRLNVGWFRDDLKDFQFLTVDPESMAASTVNAGSAVAEGVEADVTWAPTSWLTAIGALGLNDATFTDFRYGPCVSDGPRDTDGDGDPRCDLTGLTPPFVPKWSGSLTTDIGVPFASVPLLDRVDWFAQQGVEMQVGVSVEYSDGQNTGHPADERFVQPQYYRVNAHFGFGSLAQRWSLRVTGDNLTNEAVNRGRGLVSSSSTVVQQLEPPRLIYGQLRWDF